MIDMPINEVDTLLEHQLFIRGIRQINNEETDCILRVAVERWGGPLSYSGIDSFKMLANR